MRADGCYFAGALARAALASGVEFAIGAHRIAPLWRTLAGIAEGDWGRVAASPIRIAAGQPGLDVGGAACGQHRRLATPAHRRPQPPPD
ncbi:MAG TPA: hypothetical protein VGM60_01615 [Pseudonocardia sp.]